VKPSRRRADDVEANAAASGESNSSRELLLDHAHAGVVIHSPDSTVLVGS